MEIRGKQGGLLVQLYRGAHHTAQDFRVRVQRGHSLRPDERTFPAVHRGVPGQGNTPSARRDVQDSADSLNYARSGLARRVAILGGSRRPYLQQPGEPLFLSHFSHFKASSAQQFSAPFSSPQLSQRTLASASDPQLDKKARQMEVRETISSCFMGKEPSVMGWRVKVMVYGGAVRSGDARWGLVG